ncbi:MAG: hypothetical protein A2921_00855 [Candidatus Magasanikbacteria bacterium RIFCSPLOWO2_01_FULL_43_20b]|uniref:Uncharacterized protein n=1 Tax=Candidatus Magasanikbacteria bacterium RIFCSPLOWO2_12_FULL_43_12 TaxID=1798692 RepID=A0A1F6MVE6_9BACT|nr:MAG: hypothetical protein A3I93_00575 [Candidatus Magasanikbacteria bacterium RIFCSPLOWO2_02_FULL_43_22]OGH72828.1 MAG: hypothetical protein A2921_00855 [Candidatus Magasanikbacteria bacterium RIFCSPLOWO2_01_FULL_43_20b]OGH75624.1 MAG: hypothetical protein A3G00_03970 [Candidatus Magasanikbacteria bacterium RIFCSPLOWO2_12_FULL_43_12]
MKKFLIIILLSFSVLFPITVAAGPTDPPVTTVTLINPLGGTAEKPQGLTDIRVLIGNIIAGAMGVVGSLVLMAFVYGGFLWLTSAGNTEKVKKGLDTMMWAAIGLFLIFGAYAILNLVLEAIGATGGPSPVAPIMSEVPEKEKEYQCLCEENNQSSVKAAIDQQDCEQNNQSGGANCKWEEKLNGS